MVDPQLKRNSCLKWRDRDVKGVQKGFEISSLKLAQLMCMQ